MALAIPATDFTLLTDAQRSALPRLFLLACLIGAMVIARVAYLRNAELQSHYLTAEPDIISTLKVAPSKRATLREAQMVWQYYVQRWQKYKRYTQLSGNTTMPAERTNLIGFSLNIPALYSFLDQPLEAWEREAIAGNTEVALALMYFYAELHWWIYYDAIALHYARSSGDTSLEMHYDEAVPVPSKYRSDMPYKQPNLY